MKYMSLFSGIEAATVAWHPLGWEPVAFSEIEKFPNAVLQHHYPHVPNLGDVTQHHTWSNEYEPDLIVGGSPCQAFSVAGLRKGLDDERGNLTLTYLSVVDQYRPEWVVWENVPGVLSVDGGRVFGSFLGALAELGYGFSYRVLDAQFFGVPQRRRRVFVVGHLGDWQRAAQVLFEPESVLRNPPPRREAWQDTPSIPSRSTAGGGLGTDFDCDGGVIQHYEVGNCLSQCMYKGINTTLDEGHTPIVTARVAPPLDADMAAKWGNDQWVSQWKNAIPIHDKATRTKAANGPGIGVVGAPANTLGANDKHGVFAGSGVRRLTPTECERLQGFPDGYTQIPWKQGRYNPDYDPATCPDGPRYKALGNSMAVPVMHWIGRRIDDLR